MHHLFIRVIVLPSVLQTKPDRNSALSIRLLSLPLSPGDGRRKSLPQTTGKTCQNCVTRGNTLQRFPKPLKLQPVTPARGVTVLLSPHLTQSFLCSSGISPLLPLHPLPTLQRLRSAIPYPFVTLPSTCFTLVSLVLNLPSPESIVINDFHAKVGI